MKLRWNLVFGSVYKFLSVTEQHEFTLYRWEWSWNDRNYVVVGRITEYTFAR